MYLIARLQTPILAALGAAALFGASTPLAKALVGTMPAMLLAGLLYLGSGVGLGVVRLGRDGGWRALNLPSGEWQWLAGAILFGGVVGPCLLMLGLMQVSAASSSLFLNLEAALTTFIAWWVFGENVSIRIATGMLLIVVGGVILSWPAGGVSAFGNLWGPLSIAGACLCWAIDNNLTRKVSNSDALAIAASKGLVAGVVNTTLAYLIWRSLPHWTSAGAALLVGFLGYGVSLVLFVVALRGLGAARTGAYFSIAPFVGAGLAILLLNESASAQFWIAAALMLIGVWLHITERHEHMHTHEEMEHSHAHTHDEHHQHEHDSAWDGVEPHEHAHCHQPLVHRHVHFPDIHHRHGHD